MASPITLGFVVGFRGDKPHGLAIVEAVAKNGVRNKADAEIMLCAFYRRDRESKKALPLLADLIRRYPRNYLLRFEQAKMYADIGDGKSALASIDEIQRLKESGAPGLKNTPWIKIYFERATIQLGNGKKLVIESPGNSPKKQYIQSITWNGQPYTKCWFSHEQIAQGGTFVVHMADKPNEHFASAMSDRPPSFA